MEKFYIIANTEKDKDGTLSREIAEYIRENGRQCVIQGEGELTPDVECVLVLGGDGTLLRAAREIVDMEIRPS